MRRAANSKARFNNLFNIEILLTIYFSIIHVFEHRMTSVDFMRGNKPHLVL